MQSRWDSFLEASTNTAVSFAQGFLTQLIVFPLYDIHVSHAANASIVFIFLVVSFIRTLVVRRLFNRRSPT